MFLSLLGLGPAFAKLVPVRPEPLIQFYQPTERMKWFHTRARPLTRADFDRFLRQTMEADTKKVQQWWICRPDLVDYWRRELPSCIKVVPYATLPEETA
jgi:hypothetical protein